MKFRLPRPATVIAGLALVFALGGTAYAANTVRSADIVDGQVLSRDIQNRTIKGLDGSLGGSRRGFWRRLEKSASWEVPMATVNIDIDQGTVTLRGAFPPSDAPRAGRRPHRGITRARDHAEARPRFSGPAEG